MDQLIKLLQTLQNGDGNGNANITQGTLSAGEDLPNDVQKVENRYSPFAISIAATISILKSSGGFLHTLNVGMLSCPTLTIYDNASGASGTILAAATPGQTNSYLLDVVFVNGITAYLTAGNAPVVTGSYR